ncbi:hypothetical protein [Humibacter ginsengiterrae]
MTTPLEEAVIDSLIEGLRTENVDDQLLESIKSAYLAPKLPSVETLVDAIKGSSGDKLA